MTNPHTRRHLLRAALALGTTCMVQRAQACEYFAPTLRVTHPWTRATPASAGFAMLGMRFDDVTQDDQLLDVQTPVAERVVYVQAVTAHAQGVAPVALPLDIPAGRETLLGQADLGLAGPHLRLLGLTQDLEVGRSYPLRLVFRHGGSVKALLNVDYARFT